MPDIISSSVPDIVAIGSFGWGCEPPILGKRTLYRLTHTLRMSLYRMDIWNTEMQQLRLNLHNSL